MPRPPKHITLHKQRGETPLAAIERWQAANPEYAHLTASYAGRLDPMADGKLLILLGEECRKQKEYTKLDKEYVVEMLLDFSTDTGDTLGLPAYALVESNPKKADIREALARVTGTHVVPYPAFSSKPVDGKPLFQYALEGTLDDIKIPTHEETVYRAKLLAMNRVPGSLLHDRIEDILSVVPKSDEPSKALGADFRQEIIRAGWRTLLSSIPEREYTIVTLRVPCASGTYMRTLVERIAEMLGTRALALSIARTRIGTYRKIGPLGFWLRSF